MAGPLDSVHDEPSPTLGGRTRLPQPEAAEREEEAKPAAKTTRRKKPATTEETA